jgi:hypothetical protein
MVPYCRARGDAFSPLSRETRRRAEIPVLYFALSGLVSLPSACRKSNGDFGLHIYHVLGKLWPVRRGFAFVLKRNALNFLSTFEFQELRPAKKENNHAQNIGIRPARTSHLYSTLPLINKSITQSTD